MRFLTAGVPLKLSDRDITRVHHDYLRIEKKLAKVAKKRKIRVAFLVNIPSVFTMRPVFEMMSKSKIFNPFIVTVPMVGAISKEFGVDNCLAAYNALKSQYNAVYNAYDSESDSVIDFTDQADIVFLATSDEMIMPNVYKIYNLVRKGILTCYQNYTWLVSNDNNHKSGGYLTDSFSLIWRVFTESDLHQRDIENYSRAHGKNSVVTGYAKIDGLKKYTETKRNRKRIIIAPHHSVHEVGLCSRFLAYSDFFLRLPGMFPGIDFVFRPHPNLFPTLRLPEFWGYEKTNEYIQNLLVNPNASFDETAEYYDLFVNSDGIIHDCGSFLPEYMITGKPCCYMLKNDDTAKKYFNSFGRECLKYCYQAFNEEDIIKFIRDVVIDGKDTMRQERKKFVDE